MLIVRRCFSINIICEITWQSLSDTVQQANDLTELQEQAALRRYLLVRIILWKMLAVYVCLVLLMDYQAIDVMHGWFIAGDVCATAVLATEVPEKLVTAAYLRVLALVDISGEHTIKC